jgi:chromosome segregation and condensation protein ScpB
MSRAVYEPLSKAQMQALGLVALRQHISFLEMRLTYLRGAAAKETRKSLEVAQKILAGYS